MSVSIDNQILFYDWQLREMDISWAKYHSAYIKDLYASNKLYLGRIWGYDEKRGVLILKFKKGKFPRLKEPLTISYPKSSIGPFQNWNFSYGYFRENFTEQYSTCTPIFYLENDLNEDDRYVGVKNISMDFFHHIQSDLREKMHPIIVLGKEDPPRDYLVALKFFTKNNPTDNILNLDSGNPDDWKPKNLGGNGNVILETLSLIDQKDQIVVQGPPGTGKTFLIAEICNHFLNLNMRVCIAALTHKALMEAALKDGLQKHIEEGRVYKTNLSADESVEIPGLKNHEVTTPIALGSLLLSTYYSLSKLLIDNQHHVYFDLLIIEEASQAFLTTIAGFSKLGKKVMVVGDFKQLTPIVLEEKRATNIDKEISTLINGLKTYSLSKVEDSYRLINSYRLTERAVSQTGVFYNDSITSKSDEKGVNLIGGYSELFCLLGGSTLVYLENMDEGKTPQNVILLTIKLIKNIKAQFPDKKLAILSAFKDTVNSLTDTVLASKISFKNLEINTIDRIQGAEVDLCIFLIPSYDRKFSFNPNRFNVATSRARNGTLILAEDIISQSLTISKDVLAFMSRIRKIKINE
ncbi:AAA domain-containing protein [Algoriphagus halophilus]|uniref:AAA domain-containing protein n=1 Tax=Algoriphagus halophilus TaxID=226505 RepID=A0A1N6D673_9BACT|nr:AAA domain-containing protein [Algoriphagus halophilus]